MAIPQVVVTTVTSTADKHADSKQRWLLYGWWCVWLLLFALGLSLAHWQWQRAQEKQQWLDASVVAAEMNPQTLPPMNQPLQLQGVFHPQFNRWLDNRTLDGQVGLALITPLQSSDGRWWLVDRGFVATAGRRTQQPWPPTPLTEQRLQGRWQPWSGRRGLLLGENDDGHRIQQLRAEVWPQLNLQPGVVHLQEGSSGQWWQPLGVSRERHLGYAVQWLLLALVALILGWRYRPKLRPRRGPGRVRVGSMDITQEVAVKNRVKLLLLLTLLFAPVPAALAMWYWQIGIPEARVAHGDLVGDTPPLSQWALSPAPDLQAGRWHLLYRCETQPCAQDDTLWRLHRTLGRDAPRLVRWQLNTAAASAADALLPPGGKRLRWQPPAGLKHTIWLADPQGNVVLAYNADNSTKDILQDVRYLLRRNPLSSLQAEVLALQSAGHNAQAMPKEAL